MVKCGFSPLVGKIPWRRKWQPTPVFLPGKSHGQRKLVDYSPWGRERSGHDVVTKHQQQSVFFAPSQSFMILRQHYFR